MSYCQPYLNEKKKNVRLGQNLHLVSQGHKQDAKRLNQQVDFQDNSIKSLRGDIDKVKTKKDNQVQINFNHELNIIGTKENLENKKTELRYKQEECKLMEEQVEHLRSKNSERDEQNKLLNTELDIKNKMLLDKTELLTTKELETESLRRSVSRLEEDLNFAKEELNKGEEKSQSELKKLGDEIIALNTKKLEDESTIKMLSTKKNLTENDLANVKDEINRQIPIVERLNSDFENVLMGVQMVHDELLEYENKIKSFYKDFQSLILQIQMLSNKFSNLDYESLSFEELVYNLLSIKADIASIINAEDIFEASSLI